MKKYYGFGLIVFAVALLGFQRTFDADSWTGETPLREVMDQLGVAAPEHLPAPGRDGAEWIERGR